MEAPHIERPNPYRDARPYRRATLVLDVSSVLLTVAGLGFAASPFMQLVLTGTASQTDLGVSVVLLFLAVGLVH